MEHSLTEHQVKLAEWILSQIHRGTLDDSFHAIWGTGLSPVDRPILVRSDGAWQVAPFSFGDFSALKEDGFLRMLHDGGYPFPKGVKGYAPTDRHYSCAVTARMYQLGEEAGANGGSSGALDPRLQLAIFISHSGSDKRNASLLIDLLRSALNIPPDRIRCTSVDGYRLPGGASTDDQLKQEVRDSLCLIALLTPTSIRSTYVLFELGARWGAKLPFIPLLAAGLKPSNLKAPISGLNVLSCDSDSQLHQLVTDVAKIIGCQPNQPAVYGGKLQALKLSSEQDSEEAERKISPQNTSEKESHPAKREELSDDAIEILDLIQKEPAEEQRGIVVIQKEVEPGKLHFFPRLQYSGSPLAGKSRVLRAALAELVGGGWLHPPEDNQSTNTTTFEYNPPTTG